MSADSSTTLNVRLPGAARQGKRSTVTGLVRDGVVTVFNIPFAEAELFGQPRPFYPQLHDGSMRNFLSPSRRRTLSAAEEIRADLVLTVTAAVADLDAASTAPVLVWIHGGGYSNGHPSEPWTDTTNFARKGIVTVSVGYRKKLPGFWTGDDTTEFSAKNVNELSHPTRGVQDLIVALQWVKNNISAFGGDPENITLAGQSAGGALALALAAQAQREQLPVARVISMSPAFSSAATSRLRQTFIRLANGRNNPERAWNWLSRCFPMGPALGIHWSAFHPVVPTLVTSTSQEFHHLPVLRLADSQRLAHGTARALAMIYSLRTSVRQLRKLYPEHPCAEIVSDATVRRYACGIAESTRKAGIDVWAAQFCPGEGTGTDANGKPTSGAPHCVELPRFFGHEAGHPFHRLVCDFVRNGTMNLPQYGNEAKVVEFFGAGTFAFSRITAGAWSKLLNFVPWNL